MCTLFYVVWIRCNHLNLGMLAVPSLSARIFPVSFSAALNLCKIKYNVYVTSTGSYLHVHSLLLPFHTLYVCVYAYVSVCAIK